jgi:hypothetical protein
MSVQITLKQTNTLEEGTSPGLVVYRSANEITAAEAIELQLFVFDVADDAFSHVATPRDIDLYPNNKADALTLGVDRYRQASVTQDFELLDVAEDFIAAVQSRIHWLANVYDRVQAAFEGEEIFVYPTTS